MESLVKWVVSITVVELANHQRIRLEYTGNLRVGVHLQVWATTESVGGFVIVTLLVHDVVIKLCLCLHPRGESLGWVFRCSRALWSVRTIVFAPSK